MGNKRINGNQCTIIWHVNHLKISHVEKKEVEDGIRDHNKTFVQESPLTTTCGKELEYLCMALDY